MGLAIVLMRLEFVLEFTTYDLKLLNVRLPNIVIHRSRR